MTMLNRVVLSLTAVAVMTGFVGCEGPGPGPGGDPFPPVLTASVVLDNFEINKFDSKEDIVYTYQSNLGASLGAVVSAEQDSLKWGGGFWYAYASTNGAKVTTYNNDAVIVAGESAGPVNDSDLVKIFSDDTMTVELDCKSITGSDDYYAAVGVNIAGDTDHLDGSEGATVDGSSIYWNLSELESITIDGKIQGKIRLTLGAQTTSPGGGTLGFPIVGGETDLEAFKHTIVLATDLSLPGWDSNELKWDDIKAAVKELALELDTSVDDYAALKINSIVLNFKDVDAKKAAFPFIK